MILSAVQPASAFPQITVQPASVVFTNGQTVGLSVTVTQLFNVSPMFVQWRHNGANIPGARYQILSGSGTSTFTITNALSTNSGSYFAVAFDSDAAVNTTNVSLTDSSLSSLPVSATFATRGSIYISNPGSGYADNLTATNEPGAPSNDNIPGGSMVWLEAYNTSPSSGIATVDTMGSDFDTTLGVYTNVNNIPNGVTNLGVVAANDDVYPFYYFNSGVSFNLPAYSGPYEIGIDGYYASRGHIVLNWSFQATTNILPLISQQPVSQTVLSNGTTAPLTVVIATNLNNTSPLAYQWLLNGAVVSNATSSSLTLSNVLAGTVGQYRVRVQYTNESSVYSVLSRGVQIQINVEGNSQSAAQAKLHQSADPNSYPGGPVPLAVALAAGFTGTQIFSTGPSALEPGMPTNYCGKVGGSPMWYSVVPTNNGTMAVDANTPAFTNILAVYTWPGEIDYSKLVQVACGITNSGVGHQKAVFPAANGTNYFIVVDGLNNGYGQCTLNISFTSPPTIVTNPQSQTVPQGNSVTLNAAAIGTPSPAFQWRTNKAGGGQNSTFLTIPNFQGVNQGNYDVVITNLAGSVTSSLAALYLDSPMRLTNLVMTATNSFNFLLLGKANTNYIFQASTNLTKTNWVSLLTNSSSYGILNFADTNMRSFSNRFYRAIVKTN